MFDYHAELERRTAQFTKYLKRMNRRTHKIARRSCFMIFQDRPPAGEDEPVLEAKRELSRRPVPSTIGGPGGEDDLGGDDGADGADEDWRDDESQIRYIQFSFEWDWFCMDMPQQTLFRPEAEEILRRRRGFFYLEDRPEFTLYGENVEGLDPFRKIYIYGDERLAAEDMAFIFFQLWKFPVGARFYVTAAAFGGPRSCQWEQGTPIE